MLLFEQAVSLIDRILNSAIGATGAELDHKLGLASHMIDELIEDMDCRGYTRKGEQRKLEALCQRYVNMGGEY
jgi:hypothetical protein